MKRILTLCALIFVISSCQEGVEQSQSDQVEIPLNAFIDSFKAMHPNWIQNSIIEERVNKEFNLALDSFLQVGDAISGYQFRLESINEYEPGHYAVKLRSDYLNSTTSDNFNHEVIGLIDGSLIEKLEEGKSYVIKGKFLKYYPKIEPYYDYGLWNAKRGLFSDLDEEKVYLGINLYEITDFGNET